jgi:hypothetical protein
MKNCILFAAGVSNPGKLYIINELFGALKKNLPDADYFAGINANSSAGTGEAILAQITPLAMQTVPEDLKLSSDASSFQLALKLLRESGRRYDLYWFVHTKGGYNPREERLRFYINNYIGNAAEIQRLFSIFPSLGIYGLHGMFQGSVFKFWKTYNKDHIVDIHRNTSHNMLRYKHVKWTYIETFYTIRGAAINHFLEIAEDSFFNTKIGDKCYFETIIPWIPTRMGMFPYVENKMCYRGGGNLNKSTRRWITENRLENPEFDQLLAM